MPKRPDSLPDYKQPPLIEVALAVQFESLPQLRQAHLGLFWSEIIEDYPNVRDQPPLESVVERFDDGELPMFQLEITDAPPLHRAWFISADDTLLVQVQSDRFVHNWRQRGEPYPRFEPLYETFSTRLAQFEQVLARTNVPAPAYNHIEVTYINWIEASRLSEFLVTSDPPPLPSGGVAGYPDEETYATRYLVSNESHPIGRLHVRANVARRRTEDGHIDRGFILSLTFRAPIPSTAQPVEMEDLMFRGRDLIVESFTSLTRPELQTTRWERTQ